MSDEPRDEHDPLIDLVAALLSAPDPWTFQRQLNGSADSVPDLVEQGLLERWEVGGAIRLVPTALGARVLGVVLDEKVDECPTWCYPGDASKWVRCPRQWATGRHGWLAEIADPRCGPAELAEEYVIDEYSGEPLKLFGQLIPRAPRPQRGRKPGRKGKKPGRKRPGPVGGATLPPGPATSPEPPVRATGPPPPSARVTPGWPG